MPTVRRSATSLSDLKPARYNPRRISTQQKAALVKSYLEFGDLSGVVYNVRSGNLVGGHQRTSMYRDVKTTLRKRAYRDGTGTVAVGEAVVPRPDGTSIIIPYREVDWGWEKEAAANVSANSGGGEFDEEKLGRLLAELKTRNFPIEHIALGLLDFKKAIKMYESALKRAAGVDGEGGEFAAIDPKALAALAEHACPKCGYRWSGSTKPSFAEVHRLRDDNPAKIEARRLQKRVVASRQREAAQQRGGDSGRSRGDSR